MRTSSMRLVFCFSLAVTLGGAGLAPAQEAPEVPTERERLAEAILRRAELAMRHDFDPAFRAGAQGKLAGLPLEELKAREERDASAGLGPLAPEGASSSVRQGYRPVTPCRLLDTRLAGGPLAIGSPRDFLVARTNLSSQGGSATGCNVPLGDATAAVINFVAVNPTGPGNLRAWAYSSPALPPPAASILNYASVAGLNIANGLVVPLCDPGATTCTFDLKVQADVAGTHLVADVLGYFSPIRAPIVVTPPLGINDTNVTGPTCTFVVEGQVNITVPGPGRVEAYAMVAVNLVHAAGVIDLMNLKFGTTPTDCNFGVGNAQAWVNADGPVGNHKFTVPVTTIFNVPSAGTYSYYLNANMEAGGTLTNSDYVEVAPTLIRAIYYPNEP
jgi:hypothetical protein